MSDETQVRTETQAAPPAPRPAFRGAIVLKVASAAEATELAQQLEGFAEFNEPFENRYGWGAEAWCVKGKVRTVREPGPAGAADARLLEASARIGELETLVEGLRSKLTWAERGLEGLERWTNRITVGERLRLELREWGEPGEVIEPGDPAMERRAAEIANEVLEMAARKLSYDGPEASVHLNERAAQAAAELVRSLMVAPAPATEPATPAAET